jgi:hypothetical protein
LHLIQAAPSRTDLSQGERSSRCSLLHSATFLFVWLQYLVHGAQGLVVNTIDSYVFHPRICSFCSLCLYPFCIPGVDGDDDDVKPVAAWMVAWLSYLPRIGRNNLITVLGGCNR